jgi:type IV pilus assembly protein PilE
MALLATAAYPAYTESVRKAKRTEGRAALMQLMQQQERIYSQQNTYVAFSSVSANKDAFKWYSGDTPVASAYEISAAACPEESIGNCVQLTATPGTEKVDPNFQDTKCGPLSLTSTGKKLPATAGCWK